MISRSLPIVLFVSLAACSKVDIKPIPDPIPDPPTARMLLTVVTGSDAAKRQAAAETVFVRDPEQLTALVKRYGKVSMLQLFLAGASSDDEVTRNMAMSALAAHASGELPGTDPIRELVADLRYLLLEGEGGLYAKERVEPGVFVVRGTEKCSGELAQRCLALTSRVVDAESQLSLKMMDGGLMVAANGTKLLVTPEGLGSELTYTYKVNKLDQQEGKIAVWVTLSSSTPGLVEGGPVKVYVDPFLLELIGALKFAAFWRRPPPPPATTCCYYIRLVGLPNCPTCAITVSGPRASCPNNLVTCNRPTADSSKCFEKPAVGGTCAALAPDELAACKQGTGCP